jgi:hypothetical protein
MEETLRILNALGGHTEMTSGADLLLATMLAVVGRSAKCFQ